MPKKPPFKGDATLTERRHAKAIDALQRAEDQLAKALTRYQKARAKVKRYDKRADYDWRELAKSAEQIKDQIQ